MPEPQEIQVVILLALIPVMIATMYTLVQVSEEIRTRVKSRRSAHAHRATRSLALKPTEKRTLEQETSRIGRY